MLRINNTGSFHELIVRSFQLAFSLWNISLKEGPLPPSRRRSLYTLAVSMIMFSSKSYNIAPIVQSTKAVLTERKVDPFLHLVEDKLQAVSFAPDNLTISYGSKEDDERATHTLLELFSSVHQMQECFASEIIRSLDIFSKAELLSIREKLLEEFSPDDTCKIGTQLTTNIPRKDSSIVDDDFIYELFESQLKQTPRLSTEVPDLLSANQLLELVLDPSHPAGRISVTAFDTPYKDMADNCEVLMMGKHNVSRLMSTANQTQEISANSTLPTHDNELKNTDSSSHEDPLKVDKEDKVDNFFFDDNTFVELYQPTSTPAPLFCGADYQNQPHFFQLPTASPFDNFLKAAGC
ncbi:unnamed protein product [Vicia faba]|uniref:Uncharacterized protein n=1 Tax=Vicia faba TaxID=3906 RepID=A0AAV1AUA4_VICFA|nr:unnamed protein product [Vicia faba]